MRNDAEKDSSNLSMREILKEYQRLENERNKRSKGERERKGKKEEELEEEFGNRLWNGIRSYFPEGFDKKILRLEGALEGINFQGWFVMQSLKGGYRYTTSIDKSKYDGNIKELYEKIKTINGINLNGLEVSVGLYKGILEGTIDQIIENKDLDAEEIEILKYIIKNNESIEEIYRKCQFIAENYIGDLSQASLARLEIVEPGLDNMKVLKELLDKIVDDQIYIIFKKIKEREDLPETETVMKNVSRSVGELV